MVGSRQGHCGLPASGTDPCCERDAGCSRTRLVIGVDGTRGRCAAPVDMSASAPERAIERASICVSSSGTTPSSRRKLSAQLLYWRRPRRGGRHAHRRASAHAGRLPIEVRGSPGGGRIGWPIHARRQHLVARRGAPRPRILPRECGRAQPPATPETAPKRFRNQPENLPGTSPLPPASCCGRATATAGRNPGDRLRRP